MHILIYVLGFLSPFIIAAAYALYRDLFDPECSCEYCALGYTCLNTLPLKNGVPDFAAAVKIPPKH